MVGRSASALGAGNGPPSAWASHAASGSGAAGIAVAGDNELAPRGVVRIRRTRTRPSRTAGRMAFQNSRQYGHSGSTTTEIRSPRESSGVRSSAGVVPAVGLGSEGERAASIAAGSGRAIGWADHARRSGVFAWVSQAPTPWAMAACTAGKAVRFDALNQILRPCAASGDPIVDPGLKGTGMARMRSRTVGAVVSVNSKKRRLNLAMARLRLPATKARRECPNRWQFG